MTKPYRSPFKLFELPLEVSPTVLEKNKERVLHQVKHHKLDDEVYIHGTKVLKIEVLQLLKELDNYYTRQFHHVIFENKSLLNFLEFGHPNFLRNYQSNTLPNDSNFINFIAPYFGYQYSDSLLQAIKSQDQKMLQLLSIDSFPLVDSFEDKCYNETNRYVSQTVKELHGLQQKKELIHISERELVSYLPNKTIEIYNMLPDYFNKTRNLIGNEVYNLSVVLLQNYGRSDGASAILKQGLKLKLDKSIQKNLEKMLHQFSFAAKVPPAIWIALAVLSCLFLIKYIETAIYGT